MNEAESIKNRLVGNVSLVVACGDRVVEFEGRGIKNLLRLAREDRDLLCGAIVADKIVGKAAALLMIHGGVKSVYGEVMSASAAELLRAYGIEYSYGTLAERIINRKGTDICPMEKAVATCSDPADAVSVLTAALDALNK